MANLNRALPVDQIAAGNGGSQWTSVPMPQPNGGGSQYRAVPLPQQSNGGAQPGTSLAVRRTMPDAALENGRAADGRAQLGALLRRLDNMARANGSSLDQLAQEYGIAMNGNGNGSYSHYPGVQAPMTGNGCGCIESPQSPLRSARAMRDPRYNEGMILPVPGTYVPWSPELGSCPTNLSRLLCWMYKGLCSFNRFGHISSVRLTTNSITLPDPVNGFAVGPEGAATSLGVFFPRDWVAEAAFKGIHRLKVSFTVTVAEGDLTPADIQRALFDDLDFRVLQVGSETNIDTALNVGDANDAERSELAPRAGGYYLAEGREFIPFIFAPEVFSFDFRGQGPGTVLVDEYTIAANIRTWWVEVC